MKGCLAVCLAAAALAAAPAFAASTPPISIEFNELGLVVSGLPAGGSVALFGVSRIWSDFSTRRVHTREILVDDDGDGTVAFEAEIVPVSAWVAVALSSGSWAAAAPPAGELRDGDDFAPRIEREPGGGRDRLCLEVNSIDLLYVRPGEGAWSAIAYDGADEEGARNGRLRLDRASFRPLEGASSLPQSIDGRDLLVAIDPESLRVLIRRGSQLPVEEVAR